MTAPALDLFARSEALPADVAAGLVALDQSAPLWPIHDWRDVVSRLQVFAYRYDAEARRFGWDSSGLYGLHAAEPFQRVGGIGLGWVVARRGHQVLSIDRIAISLRTRSAAIMRFYRGTVDREAVPAWQLVEVGDPALPVGRAFRWTAQQKAAVVLAVESGRLSLAEAERRYHLSAGEFTEWQLRAAMGLKALGATSR